MSRRYKGGVISATAPTISVSSATGVWTLPQQMVGQAAGVWPYPGFIGGPFWIGIFGGAGNSQVGNSVAVDSSGNVYLCGAVSVSTTDLQIVKYNISGVVQWQRRLDGSYTDTGLSVTVDSSGNVYVCGETRSDVGTSNFLIAKYNTSGVLQWQKKLGGDSSHIAFSVAVDSSGNVYVCGQGILGAYASRGFVFAKFNSSGTQQWARGLGKSEFSPAGRSVALDSSGNVYICGFSEDNGSPDFVIAKYNNSGTIQWQRRLGGGGDDEGLSIAVDSSANVYVCGKSGTGSSVDIILAKYNTSGTIQWQRKLDAGSETQDFAYSIAVSSSGNVYICGQTPSGGQDNLFLAKYDTSGTIQFQRRLGNASQPSIGYSVAVDSTENVYVCGYTSVAGGNDFLFAKLPGDGSDTGTYTVGGYSFTYAAATLTATTASLTDAAATLVSLELGDTSSGSSLTDAATTLTSSVTTI